jgi:protein TonB
MFEDSLLESGGRLKDKRGRYTGVAFLIEAALLGVALLIPLYYTDTLPAAQLMTYLVAPPPPPPPPPPPSAAPVRAAKVVETDVINGQLRPCSVPVLAALRACKLHAVAVH